MKAVFLNILVGVPTSFSFFTISVPDFSSSTTPVKDMRKPPNVLFDNKEHDRYSFQETPWDISNEKMYTWKFSDKLICQY